MVGDESADAETMDGGGNDESKWLCPWCRNIAALSPSLRTLCYSKACECGAVALGAPPWDEDETVDDAIMMFNVEVGEQSRGNGALLLKDIQKSGVDIRRGSTEKNIPGMPEGWEVVYIWFRPRPPESQNGMTTGHIVD